MNKQFTINDLESTDVIELRNGKLGIIFKEQDLIVYQNDGIEYLSEEYEEDFTSTYSHSYDVVRVYRHSNGFMDLEDDEPIFEREDKDVIYEEKPLPTPVFTRPENLITILAQAFYGNRVISEIKREDVDKFVLGHHCDLPLNEPIDRTIIHVPNHEGLVIIYNKYQEEDKLERIKEWYEKDGYVAKPLAEIPELNLKIYSRPIACRIDEKDELQSLQDSDFEVLFHYFSR